MKYTNLYKTDSPMGSVDTAKLRVLSHQQVSQPGVGAVEGRVPRHVVTGHKLVTYM